jgi:hypothetical protein
LICPGELDSLRRHYLLHQDEQALNQRAISGLKDSLANLDFSG